MHTSSIERNINLFLQIYKQAVCKRGTERKKKVYLRLMDCKIVIAILAPLFYNWKGDNISTVESKEANQAWVSGTII